MWMYKFAEEIKHEETVLNYGALDLGVYTASQKIPSNKFFCKLNINYPEMLKEQKKSVLQGESDYVVMRLELDDEIPRYIFAQYDLCKREVDIQDGRDFQFLLFKLRKH